MTGNMNNYLNAMSSSLPGASEQRRVRQACVSVLLAIFVSCALAQQAASDVTVRYPAGSIRSVAQADAALADMVKERAGIEAHHAAEVQVCSPKFFATACIDEAKERRRKALIQLRSIEIEAHAVKRQARVDARDEALAERRAKEEADRQERQRRQQEQENALLSTDASDEEASVQAERKARAGEIPDRSKKHEARLRQVRAKDASDAEKRAENVAAYEKKVQAAQKRQQQVLDRKAEKERKRQEKPQVSTRTLP